MKSQNPITVFRQAHKLTRKELAHRSGVSYATLSNIETGLVNGMRERTLTTIAEFTRKRPEVLRKEFTEWRESLRA
jgi:transcriptional regulator with XRE-family HTH domain